VNLIQKTTRLLSTVKWKSVLQAELVFLLLILFNTFKLTGIQYAMTGASGFPLWKMAVRNLFFLYCSWRMVFLIKPRIPFLILYILQTVFMTVLLLVFLYSGEILQLSQIFTVREGVTAIGSLKIILANPLNLLPVSDLIPVLFLFYRYPRIRKNLLPLSVPMILLSGLGVYALAWKMDYFKADGREWGVLGQNAKFGTIYTSLVLSDTSREEDAIRNLSYGPEITVPSSPEKHNIITIQVESLTADILGLTYGNQPVMPYLTSLAGENLFFPYMIAQHKTGASSDAEFSMINGIEAVRGFPACQFSLYDYPNSLVKRFPDEVRTAAFHANTGDYFNRTRNLPAMGFSTFYDMGKMGIKENRWGGSDEDLFNFAVKTLQEEKSPYYYHIITMTSHGPFHFTPPDYQNSRFDNLSSRIERDFLVSMAYVDEVLSKAVPELRKLDGNSWIFIYGDHPIRLSGDVYRDRSHLTYDSRDLPYVPLIILAPDGRRYRESEKAVSIMDIAATVLDVSGYGGTIRSFGSSLLHPEALPETLPNDGKEYSRRSLFHIIDEFLKGDGD